MELLVVGAAGLLGSNVVAGGLERGHSVTGAYHSEPPDLEVPLAHLDIRNGEAFAALLERHTPDAVVNCAAATDVDGCERNPDRAEAVNGRAPEALAAACHDREIMFAHVSTDYVFDGKQSTLYDETADTAPLQVYGTSKLAGEEGVLATHPGALVARVSFLWGIHRASNDLRGFPAWVRDRLRDGEETPLFTDQRVTPSRAGATAATLLDLLDAGATGLFHVASRSCVTPHAFGERIRERLGVDSGLVTESEQADLDRPATRPRDTCLDVSKVETTLGRAQPTLAADLDAVAGLL